MKFLPYDLSKTNNLSIYLKIELVPSYEYDNEVFKVSIECLQCIYSIS